MSCLLLLWDSLYQKPSQAILRQPLWSKWAKEKRFLSLETVTTWARPTKAGEPGRSEITFARLLPVRMYYFSACPLPFTTEDTDTSCGRIILRERGRQIVSRPAFYLSALCQFPGSWVWSAAPGGLIVSAPMLLWWLRAQGDESAAVCVCGDRLYLHRWALGTNGKQKNKKWGGTQKQITDKTEGVWVSLVWFERLIPQLSKLCNKTGLPPLFFFFQMVRSRRLPLGWVKCSLASS